MKCTRNRKPSFLPIALALLAGCGLVSRDEVARVASPDGRVEGVLIETNGGATTSFGYEAFVVMAKILLGGQKPHDSQYEPC